MSILMLDVLQTDEVKAYLPGYHKGDCIEPYIVLKTEGAVKVEGISSERPIYTVMCYVPFNRYTELEQMVYDVKQRMKSLYPMVRYEGNETPSYYDSTVKGHMISFQYLGIRKIELM